MLTVFQRVLLGVCAGMGGIVASGPAAARQIGTDIEACNGCHEHGTIKDAKVTADNHLVMPGGTAKFQLMVKRNSPDEIVSGFIAKTEKGQLGIVDNEYQRFHMTPGVITHTKPKPFDGDSVLWEFTWTAPQEVGVTVIKVSTVAGNGSPNPPADPTPSDDVAAQLQTWAAHGCDGKEYFPDRDKDGYGDPKRLSKPSCEPVPDYVPNGLDCADDDPLRNPDATELCNSIDDDCNGDPDNGMATRLLYPDGDGDGHGDGDGDSMLACPPVAGFAERFDDCDDSDPNVSPTAKEVCNGKDDNCDRRIDNDAVTICGVGACASAPIPGCNMPCTPGTPTAEVCNQIDDDCDGTVDNSCTSGPVPPGGGVAVDGPVEDSGGCSVERAHITTSGVAGWVVLGLALGLGLARRRR